MEAPVQSILVPVVKELPHKAIAYAELLAAAYEKPIVFLCLNPAIYQQLLPLGYYVQSSDLSLKEAVDECVTSLDVVMVVWGNDHKRSSINSALLACRKLRIPYFFVPDQVLVRPPQKVVIPMGFLVEEREKAVWARSLKRHFDSVFTILKPRDKGSRASQNVAHVEAFFEKHDITWVTLLGRKSSFKIEKEALSFLREWSDMTIVTASREYGLDDQFFGPKELWLIKKSAQVLMILNPRDDLYILCGD